MKFRARGAAEGASATPPARTPLRVYTVPPGRAFLAAIAEALLAGDLPVPGGRRLDPWELAGVTLYLPTRRATRALQEAFLKASGGSALLLPRIKPITDGLDELTLLSSIEELGPDADAGLPSTISGIERQLVLTKLVFAWSEAMRSGPDSNLTPYAAAGASSPAQAVKLAQELARLMDTAEIEEVSLSKLGSLVPDAFSEHWAQTLEFLQLLTKVWPLHLQERGLASPMRKRSQLMVAEAERLATAAPMEPVIVAGVTASFPAAARLMSVVAGLPNGALVLPGLDQRLDEESWQAIVPQHPEHPQFALKKLLDVLGLNRHDVLPLCEQPQAPMTSSRSTVISEAMRPAETTAGWRRFAAEANPKDVRSALAGVSLLEAATADQEAEAIALILREVLETTDKTAALVTPDRRLARRIAVKLQSWSLQIEDAAGRPFARTVPGIFLNLIANAAAARCEPITLMALLKHPLCRLGMGASEARRAAQALELAIFRAPYFGRGLDDISSSLERAAIAARSGGYRPLAARRLSQADWQAARELVHRLRKAFRPMAKLFASANKARLQDLAKAHVQTAEALARTSADTGISPVWRGDEGEWAARLFAELLDANHPAPDLRPLDYPEFYGALIAGETMRPRGPSHPRISIWGLSESRLQQPDIVILGSLNEGTWPRAAEPGPWLNRPMRQMLGLSMPEERVGHAAHDFASLLVADRVYLTRAAKTDGVPTVPSRWLLRLRALLQGVGLDLDGGEQWLAWAQIRNTPEGPTRPVRAPEPRPPVEMRPRQLSATTIEKWIANPYAIFAQRILRLEPLPPLGEEPGAALRGRIVHETLGRFTKRFPHELPQNVYGELLAMAHDVLAEYTGNPRVTAFWAQRFARFAAWFSETEPTRRAGMKQSLAEVQGELVLEGAAGPFTVRARADRIDVSHAGLMIADYKTGANLDQLARRAVEGAAPQLPLEAAIANAGGFTGVAPGLVVALRYISASGGEPPGQEIDLKCDDIAALARDTRDGLSRLIAEFDRETTPYRALRRARFNYEFDDYAHLARVAEWSTGAAEDA